MPQESQARSRKCVEVHDQSGLWRSGTAVRGVLQRCRLRMHPTPSFPLHLLLSTSSSPTPPTVSEDSLANFFWWPCASPVLRCMDDEEDSTEATTLPEPGGGDAKVKKAYLPGPECVRTWTRSSPQGRVLGFWWRCRGHRHHFPWLASAVVRNFVMDVQESTKRLLLRNRRSTAPKVILEFHVLLGLTLFRERLQLPVRCSIFWLHVLTVLCNPVRRHVTMEVFLLVTMLNVGKLFFRFEEIFDVAAVL